MANFLELLGHLERLDSRLGLLGFASTRRCGLAGALLSGNGLGVTGGFGVAGEACDSSKCGDGQGNNNLFHRSCEFGQ